MSFFILSISFLSLEYKRRKDCIKYLKINQASFQVYLVHSINKLLTDDSVGSAWKNTTGYDNTKYFTHLNYIHTNKSLCQLVFK